MTTNSIKGPVLVTGGAGYIGGQTVLSLLDRGIEVCVLDDLSTGSMRPFHEETHFYEGRIQDQALVKDIITRHGVQSILHFAGSIKVDESISNPLKYYENNTDGSRKLIAVAVEVGVKRFIFSSTAAVYGTAPKDGLVSEGLVPCPLNPYGWSKLFTEHLLRDVSQANGLQYGIFRYFNVAGADPAMRHGQFLKNPVHLIGRAINAMFGEAPPLQVFGSALPTADGTGVRDYIHVFDLAEAHVALLGRLSVSPESRLMNLGYGRGSSVLEVIDCIEKVSGRPVPHAFVAAREGEAPSVVANIEKLNSDLKWTAQYNDLTKIVSHAISWMDNHR